MQEYIRIDEAVRKYGKTRQTFYNYINKGILEVKKINNRLFLEVGAIENLMNTIIEDYSDTTSESDRDQEQSESKSYEQHFDILEDLITYNYQNTLEQLQQSFSTHVGTIKSEILYDLKNIIGTQLNHVVHNQNNYLLKHEHLENKVRSLHQHIEKSLGFQKKGFFYGGIIALYILQYIIIQVLS